MPHADSSAPLYHARSGNLSSREHALAVVGELSCDVCHEVANLLAAAALNLGAAREMHCPSRDEALETALRAVEMARRLNRDVLGLIRTDVRVVADLNTLLSDYAPLIRSIVASNIKLAARPCAVACPVFVDIAMLGCALLNLAMNARDAMPDGGALTLSCGFSRPAGLAAPVDKFAFLSVSDTGTGMTPDVVERATEQFFTTKDPGKGTGLGLSNVSAFVRNSFGHLEICAAPGVGTTVRLLLPLAVETPSKPSERH